MTLWRRESGPSSFWRSRLRSSSCNSSKPSMNADPPRYVPASLEMSARHDRALSGARAYAPFPVHARLRSVKKLVRHSLLPPSPPRHSRTRSWTESAWYER
jgi:hypothetical protein